MAKYKAFNDRLMQELDQREELWDCSSGWCYLYLGEAIFGGVECALSGGGYCGVMTAGVYGIDHC